MIPYTDLHAQYSDCKKDVDNAIQFCLDNSQYITGQVISEFEYALSTCVGAEDCAATGSGSMSLILALQALGVGEAHEVITTPMTFVATPEAIVNVGAKPVFVDVDDNYLIDVDKIEAAITPKTKAILFVSLYGQSPDLIKLRSIADKHNLKLIDDAAQSCGSFTHGEPTGSSNLVDATCFSFNPVKNLGAIGDAGAVTGSSEVIHKIKILRDHGRSDRYEYELIGYNSRMDCIQAKVLTAKLPYLQGWTTRIREICNKYTDELKNVITPTELDCNYHSYYAYVVQHDNRDGVQQYLFDNGVGTNIHYVHPCHIQKAYKDFKSDCPKAEYLSKRILSLPSYFSLHNTDQDVIIRLINDFL